jgi:hypothetical protein
MRKIKAKEVEEMVQTGGTIQKELIQKEVETLDKLKILMKVRQVKSIYLMLI